ncbi:MAG: FHA domain-containing protein [Prevotella sp.]|nr:FHA domain-containing protein [Prevotella sp.]
MPRVLIGKEGEQKFPIKGERVSRKHCFVEFDEKTKQWTVEDAGSANGTFILDEEGKLRQVKQARIDEFTRIVLADNTALGYSFFAHHILEENPENYTREFHQVMKMDRKLKEEEDEFANARKKRQTLRYLPSIISGVIGLVVFILWPERRMEVLVFTALLTPLLSVLMNFILPDEKDKAEKLKEKRTALVRCPKCNRPLSSNDLKMNMCPQCKAHA